MNANYLAGRIRNSLTQLMIGRIESVEQSKKDKQVFVVTFAHSLTSGQVDMLAAAPFSTERIEKKRVYVRVPLDWLGLPAIDTDFEPLAIGARSVNKHLVALTVVCEDCGQQYERFITRKFFEEYPEDAYLLAFNPLASCCPVCEKIAQYDAWKRTPTHPVTTGSTNIRIGGIHTDDGAWHRAVVVARALYDAGLWDGQEEITIEDPYRVHGVLSASSAYELQLGIHYRFGSRELRAGTDTTKAYLITPEVYRAGEYGKRRRAGQFKIYARWGNGWREVDHVTYDTKTDEYFVWFFGVEAPQPVANVYCLEVHPKKPRFLLGSEVRLDQVAYTRHHEHEQALRELLGKIGTIIEIDGSRHSLMPYHVRFGNGVTAWLAQNEVAEHKRIIEHAQPVMMVTIADNSGVRSVEHITWGSPRYLQADVDRLVYAAAEMLNWFRAQPFCFPDKDSAHARLANALAPFHTPIPDGAIVVYQDEGE